jgi:hypothetical protein
MQVTPSCRRAWSVEEGPRARAARGSMVPVGRGAPRPCRISPSHTEAWKVAVRWPQRDQPTTANERARARSEQRTNERVCLLRAGTRPFGPDGGRPAVQAQPAHGGTDARAVRVVQRADERRAGAMA